MAGGPGCGKTTLMHQLVFSSATVERPALYFTILGEPPLKMLRYQQQFGFFDPAKLDGRIRFIHLGDQLVAGGLEQVLETVMREVDASAARMVVVDSFRSALPEGQPGGRADLGIQHFVQRLALHLTSREATTFLVGEYLEHETNTNPLFTIADGILWLYQQVLRNSVTRRLQVVKLRGQREVPGLHTFRIDREGLRVFPRLPQPSLPALAQPEAPPERKRTGVEGLDEMLGGGIPPAYSVLVAGPSGSGKTVLTTSFVLEGASHGEPGVIAVFEKRPEEYLRSCLRADELTRHVAEGRLSVLYQRPIDLSIDETLEQIRAEVLRLGAKRVVLDSLSGLELALGPGYREDFRESLYRMVAGLTALGVTVMATVEIADSYTELRTSPHAISFLPDAIILQRYVELDGRLRKVLSVMKVRGHPHSDELRPYEIAADKVVVGESLREVNGILTGRPTRPTAVPAHARTDAGEP